MNAEEISELRNYVVWTGDELGAIHLTRLGDIAALAPLLAELETLRGRVAGIRTKIEEIVCTKDPDKGVVLLSNDGPTHIEVYDTRKYTVYAEKAAAECDDKSIEWLFQPSNMFELLCRIDVDVMDRKVSQWFFDMSPDAMPHRFRPPYLAQMQRAIDNERFYRRIKAVKAAQPTP